MTPFDLDTILADFFALLGARRFHDCELLLRSARDHASSPVEHAWLDYLEAILLSEKPPPRWDLAEKKMRHLLNAEIPDELLARVHLEVAFAADYLGDYAQAIEHNRKSQRLFEHLGDQEYVAKVLKNTGIAHTRAFERGQADRSVLDQALDCHRRSLALARAFGDERLADTVELELGTVYKALNRWDEARSQYTFRAARCRRFRPTGWQRSLALALDNLGEVYHHLGRWSHAHTSYQTALRLLCALPDPDPYEEADVWANLAQFYQAQGRMAEAVAASDAAIRLIETLRDPLQGENARIGFLGSRIQIYEQRVLLDMARGDPHAALTTLERAKARAFIELLAGYAPPDVRPGDVVSLEQVARRQAAPLDAAAIQQRLPPDTALIEYMVAPGQAVAFVVSRNDLTVIPLAASLYEDLGPAFERNRHRLQQMAPDHEGILHTPWLLPLLQERLIAPLSSRLADKLRLVIVPYGRLHYIPFHALLHQSSEERTPEIIHAPSATVLLAYCCAKPPARGRGGAVFSVGDDLRYVEREAAAVAARLAGPWFQNLAATVAAAIGESADYPILHFACHAHFDPEDPLASGLTLADGRLTVRQILDDLRLHADLVVLSGCETGQNRLHRGDELIGLVRAFIYAGTPSVLVSLWPVDDVSTGLLMETFYAHLLAGHSPAAALASAQQTLRTLPTVALRQRLIASGLSDRDAEAEITRLRQAAAKLLAASFGPERLLAHPYYWAPFMLVGDRLAAPG
ncbi:CHAT domain-containing protein [Candidatus Amarolinea aalborgensis]|uniref:CHAT domain-containing protein n=1 Tax=Candidatus Amarolinea aalborgensis TaxID=2249329 RepID=UPI003BF9F33F